MINSLVQTLNPFIVQLCKELCQKAFLDVKVTIFTQQYKFSLKQMIELHLFGHRLNFDNFSIQVL